jgi:hypothetical protein
MSPINITMETYMQIFQKMLKKNNYLQDLYASIVMDVKKKTITRPICRYCNGCKKLATITRPIWEYCNGCKKLATITRPICGYYNGCKKLRTITIPICGYCNRCKKNHQLL